jgi:hypothetical protein
MTFDEFKLTDAQIREEYPARFEMSTAARCATPEMIDAAEAEAGIKLPDKYRAFLMEYGGGDYGTVVIYSADATDEWYFPRRNLENRPVLPDGYLAFSDDFCGGFYVLKIVGNAGLDKVFYWCYDDEAEEKTPYEDVLEYIAACATGS